VTAAAADGLDWPAFGCCEESELSAMSRQKAVQTEVLDELP
jgi:hypothetical protein